MAVTPIDTEFQKETLSKKVPDRSYINEYNRYVKWLQDNGINQQPPAEGSRVRYITKDNIELYYSEHIAKERLGGAPSLQRVRYTLQWYADYRERPLEGFKVKSAFTDSCVDTCLQRQKTDQKARLAGTATGTDGRKITVRDPHQGLKDGMAERDRLDLMDYVYSKRSDWASCAFSHLWGMNAAVRGASNRVFSYCDLNLSHLFGPERSGLGSRCLLMVLRKGDLHKDRKETDQQVGAWRHRNYLLCPIFATALGLLKRLSLDDDINFYHEDIRRNPTENFSERTTEVDWCQLKSTGEVRCRWGLNISNSEEVRSCFTPTSLDNQIKARFDACNNDEMRELWRWFARAPDQLS